MRQCLTYHFGCSGAVALRGANGDGGPQQLQRGLDARLSHFVSNEEVVSVNGQRFLNIVIKKPRLVPALRPLLP